MRREIDIYDPIEDKIVEKKPLSPNAKKTLIFLGCALIGIIVAAVLLYIFDLAVTGAPTPEKAIAEYEKAAILYDIDDMIEYSSEYNKIVLYGNKETSDRLLTDYLEKGYEGKTSQYASSEIGFKLVSAVNYEKGSKKYNEALEKYCQKVENGADTVDEISIVRMTVVKGTSETTRNYVAVKIGSRWYFAFAQS